MLVCMKLLLFGLLLEQTFGNIEDEASKDEAKHIKISPLDFVVDLAAESSNG